MPSRRVTFQEHEEALAVCAKIKARHPDILERGPDGLYRYMLAGPDLREALYDYLAADRVAKAWARKRPAKDADLDRLRTAVERYG
jgi:hypothetical protein